ncbi:DNA polymerase III subunit epsilon [Rhodovibrio sodomensis]|uniref:DNA polymerase III subunit epsilon n=1 Tax=Rhodovibrio sodomensis TaxID=1088 RepID=A0ABS1D9Q7_9PROT|nr:DNA polymerase III subunit epsilon [Rhodovibrio sodomensis]MBK1666473.1 DNA polymerase III subunit epsilon [Rhodovibrio sodomensis]
MREIIWDTETTGTNPNHDQIIEIGMVEMVDDVLTGEQLHLYIRPTVEIHEEAQRVHGITMDRLRDEKPFDQHVDRILAFIGDAPLVAHNARFDMGFLNAEIRRLIEKFGRTDLSPIPDERAIDTLELARKRFPGAKLGLDALCSKFKIDNAHRKLHGALLDSELLAEVYIELKGGRQRALDLAVEEETRSATRNWAARPDRTPRVHRASAEEIAAHQAFIDKKIPNSVWNNA